MGTVGAPILMQDHDITDRQGMPSVIFRVVYIEFLIDCFQHFALCLLLQFRQISYINQFIIFWLDSIKIVLCNTHTL